MIIILIQGIVSCLLSLGLKYLYNITNKHIIDMKKRCICTVNGTFVKFVEKEISSRFDTSTTRYSKIYFPIYEYYVDEKRFEVESCIGGARADESRVEKNKIVYYNPNKLEESFIKGENLKEAFKSIKILEKVFLVLGLFLIALYFILKAVIQ